MIKYLFDFIEIRTKLISLMIYFVSLSYLLINQIELNYLSMGLFLVAMIAFDSCVTAINSYYSLKYEPTPTAADLNKLKMMDLLKISHRFNLSIIIFLLTVSLSIGVYLIIVSGINILIYGTICLVIGVVYSYGPLPICRTPLGEAASGLTMGFFIPLIIFQLNNISIYSFNFPNITFDLLLCLKFFLAFFPLVLLISNVMLANNYSDHDYDLKNKRYTLVVLIGEKQAALLYKLSYFATIICSTISLILGFTPLIAVVPIILLIFKANFKLIPLAKAHNMQLSLQHFLMYCLSTTTCLIIASFLSK